MNAETDETRKIIHLLVTSLCNRNCPHCCNKQYDLNEVPYVTAEELAGAHTVCITGGEPFLFSNPSVIARYLKRIYPNIRNVYAYTNATELVWHLAEGGSLQGLDGLNVSIKNSVDAAAFKQGLFAFPGIKALKSNRLYVFNSLFNEDAPGFEVYQREWQKDFTPAPDSIFRKL